MIYQVLITTTSAGQVQLYFMMMSEILVLSYPRIRYICCFLCFIFTGNLH